jgi:hypothetical protein
MCKSKLDQKTHDDHVLEIAQMLKDADLGYVCAHLRGNHGPTLGFGTTQALKTPDHVLASFVPTAALFSCMAVFSNLGWKKPDLTVTHNDFTYVLDVSGANSTYISVAHKIETVIANAAKRRIVGLAIVEMANPTKASKEQVAKLKRLRSSFHLLFGYPTESTCPEKSRTYLEPLFSHPDIRPLCGAIHWDAVLEISVADSGWADTLCQHVKDALDKQILLAQPPA